MNKWNKIISYLEDVEKMTFSCFLGTISRHRLKSDDVLVNWVLLIGMEGRDKGTKGLNRRL